MITERMLELVLLEKYIKEIKERPILTILEREQLQKMIGKRDVLKSEFLGQY